MQRVNEYRFYELGQRVQRLKDVKAETSVSDALIPLWEARESINALIDDALKLRVCGPIAHELRDVINNIIPTDFREAMKATRTVKREGQPDHVPTIGHHAWEVSDALGRFEPVLAAECAAMDTYVVSQKRAYSTPHLVDGSESMLSDDSLSLLNKHDGIIEDVRAAGRCLAFDTPTAAGFHILRATEAVMALYFQHVAGRQLKKRHRNWGLYLLRLAKVATADKRIIGALEHIKENYRNPITHPDVTLSENAAAMLFSLSLSVIEMMAEIVRTTTPALPESEALKALAEIAEQQEVSEDGDF